MVTSTHFYRQFHSLSSSVPFSFSVTSIYHNRFHSLRLSPPVFLLLIYFGVPHFERTGSQTRHKASSALQELGAREDKNHIHRHRNLKVGPKKNKARQNHTHGTQAGSHPSCRRSRFPSHRSIQTGCSSRSNIRTPCQHTNGLSLSNCEWVNTD